MFCLFAIEWSTWIYDYVCYHMGWSLLLHVRLSQFLKYHSRVFLNKQNTSFILTNKSNALYFLWPAKLWPLLLNCQHSSLNSPHRAYVTSPFSLPLSVTHAHTLDITQVHIYVYIGSATYGRILKVKTKTRHTLKCLRLSETSSWD